MKKRIGSLFLALCMLLTLLPSTALAAANCDGDHDDGDLVLKYNETMHWVECSKGGLTCMSGYYGEEISDPSQVTDDMLLDGVLDMYFALHEEQIEDYYMWMELLYSEGDAVEHTYNGTTTCILCHYDKTADGDNTNGGNSDSGSGSTGTGSGSGSGGSSSGSGSVTNGYQLTLNYDAAQCSVVVTDRNNNNAEVKSGDYLMVGTYGATMEVDVYVEDGYRIKSVSFTDKKGTEDLTEHYIVGSYGWDPFLYAYSNCTLTIETEVIPSKLPTVTGIKLYSDEARTTAMSKNVTLATGERTKAYVKATYADGTEYPNYIARGEMEFSLDGEAWLSAHQGIEEIDLTVNYCQYEDAVYQTGTEYTKYDYRFCVEPDDIYWTGDTVYSEVYHVNGGASGDSGSGDSGSGTTCEHANTTTINQKNATCGKDGYTGDTYCNDCKKTIESGSTIPATGKHSWNDGVITTQPTVENEGVKTFTCTVCGATKTEPVAKLKMQDVYWFNIETITVTYGDFNYVQPTAYNDTVEECVFTYTSSDESVATVDANGKTAIKGAGTAIITATAPAVAGYAETSASYTLTVKKAPLTVTAKDHTIAYGQAPANNGFTVSGLVNNEDESVLTGTPAYTYSCEQYDKVGTYAIDLSGLSAKNYEITFAPGTLTVEQAKDYTISFQDNQLEQVAGHLSDISASVEPYDSTAELLVEYQINDQWVNTLPADLAAGSYAIRASLTASDNIELDGAYTDGVLVVKNGVTVNPGQGVENVEIGVDVEDGKASLDISDPAQITDKANGDVKIDIGGVSGAKELELPAGLMTGLSQNEKVDSLTVTTEDASVKLSGAVVDTVANAVKSGEDTVTVRLTSVEKDELNDKQQAALDSISQDAVIVEVSLVVTHTDGSQTELHELGGNTEITVPYDGPVPEGKYIVVSYVSNDGSVSYVRATYNKETKQVSFKTNHFSHYVLYLSGQNTYDLTVVDGAGSGTYLEGSAVTVKAERKSGYTFTGWTVTSGELTLEDSTQAEITFTMPAGDVTLTANYRKHSSGGGSGSSAKPTQPEQPVQPTQPVNPFVDVTEEDYFYDAVLWAVEQGVTGGTSATTFSPDAACTRAQIVTFLWNAAGKPEVKGADSFADVSADAYYAKAVAWAVANGITSGTGKDTFSPDLTCTRAQAMTILYRASGSPAVNTAADFSDVAADAYYASAVAWAVDNGITSGIGGGLFGSDDCCTRAQIVTFLWKADQLK